MKTYQEIFEPLLHHFVTLVQEGVFIDHLGTFITGTVQHVVADSPGAHGLAGFVVTSGEYFCRFCAAMHSEIESKEVKIYKFSLKTEELHCVHIESACEGGTACCEAKGIFLF